MERCVIVGGGDINNYEYIRGRLQNDDFIVFCEDNLKLFYYRGLKEWDREKDFLMDTCLTAQDRFKAFWDYFRIAY